MRLAKEYTDVRWWKAYVIYLVITLPFVVLVIWLIPHWWRWFAVTALIIAGSSVKDRIQRKVWP